MKDHLELVHLICLTEIHQTHNDNALFEKIEALEAELKPLLAKYGLNYLSWEGTDFSCSKYAVERCAKCEHWLVNRSKNSTGFGCEYLQEYWNIDSIIYDGAEHNGQTLCTMCLPSNHRWGLST